MPKKADNVERILNVRPDTLDFRDKMYEATLFEVPIAIKITEYKKYKIPILDQGTTRRIPVTSPIRGVGVNEDGAAPAIFVR